MLRRLAALFACLALIPAPPAQADSSDIDAAARGVVRVIIVEKDGDQLVPISHGTGFAVAAERVVTNSHVVEAADDITVRLTDKREYKANGGDYSHRRRYHNSALLVMPTETATPRARRRTPGR